MENNSIEILNKQYVLEHGTDFDEKLWFTSYNDLVLDNPEDEDGQPFSGLAYELYKNGNLIYYCYYINGFAEGDNVEFYESGKIKSHCCMVRGQIRGIEKNGMKVERRDMKESINMVYAYGPLNGTKKGAL